MSLVFHWFLPTSGDGRGIVGRGHSIPLVGLGDTASVRGICYKAIGAKTIIDQIIRSFALAGVPVIAVDDACTSSSCRSY